MSQPYRVAQPVAKSPGPAQRIPVDISITQGGCSIGARPCHLEMGIGSIRDHNRDFVSVMKKVQAQVVRARSLELDTRFYRQVMDDLRDAGISAYQSLGDQVAAYLAEYEEKDRGLGLNIEVHTEAHPLLWEFIYTGSAIVPVDPHLFWGYRHPIARFLIGAEYLPPVLDSPGDFLFCRNHRLGHWKKEMASLHGLVEGRGFITLDDCLDVLSAEQRKLALRDQILWVCTHHLLSFVHLASHLRPAPRSESVLGALLVISYQDSEIEIPLRRLNAIRRDKWMFQQSPLIFLNACQTMTHPEQLGQGENFPRSFLKLGAGAVIATACDIPDLFAVAFAHKFYELFLDRRQPATASDALRQARRFFMDRFNNPLGLAYGLYGYNDLTIYW
jgi:hypothetical protein